MPWRTPLTVLLVFAVLAPMLTAWAEFDPNEEAIPRPTGLEKSLTKLGRGIANVALGWAEIPKAVDAGIRGDKPLGYIIGVAPVLGTARALMRTSTGMYEMFTFPFSDRDVNYEAVIEPEYVF